MKNAKILRRKRIEKELDILFDFPLTIVSATMGMEKTTTLRTYLSHKKNIEKFGFLYLEVMVMKACFGTKCPLL